MSVWSTSPEFKAVSGMWRPRKRGNERQPFLFRNPATIAYYHIRWDALPYFG